VQELYDTDPYIRRKIAQNVMKEEAAIAAGNGSESGEMNSYYKD
jgi:hypothetical protein